MSHKRLADYLLTQTDLVQTQFNAASAKLEVAHPASQGADKAELVIQDVKFTAKTAGLAGNDIAIEYIDDGSNGLELTEVGNTVTINFGGDNDVRHTEIAALVSTLVDISAESTGDAIPADATMAMAVNVYLEKVAAGSTHNGDTFTLQIAAAAANPTNTILAVYTGTSNNTVLTITPNDGTNNGATPVNMTISELVEFINTGAVVGKTITITDVGNLKALLTATSAASAAVLADGGEGDGIVGTFANGVESVTQTAPVSIDNLAGGLDLWAAFPSNWVSTCAMLPKFAKGTSLIEMYIRDVEFILRAKLGSTTAADEIMAAILNLETKFNAALAKMDAEAGTLNDVNYVSTLGVSVLDVDRRTVVRGRMKASIRQIVRSAFANKRLADKFLAVIVDAQTNFNTMLALLDAKTFNGVDLSIEELDADGY